MKVMVCSGIGIGALPQIDLPASSVGQWQAGRISALKEALKMGADKGAEACVIAGGLFANGFVAQSLFDATWEALGNASMPVYYFAMKDEAKGLEGRVPPCEGVQVTRLAEGERKEVSLCGHRVWGHGGANLSDEDLPQVNVYSSPDAEGHTADVSAKGMTWEIRPLEPSAFGHVKTGFLLQEFDGREFHFDGSEWVRCAKHPFVTKAVELDGITEPKQVIAAAGNAVKDFDRNSCLRIELRGKLPLNVYVNPDDLAERIGQYFTYCEVADLCELDLEVGTLDTDVSLLAEFVRQVSGDDTLSDTEKTRILRCGWNALNGKDLVE